MPQGTRPDWVAIRTEYESGASHREIRAKYGVKESALQSQINRGGWKQSKERIARNAQGMCEAKIAQCKADEAENLVEIISEGKMLTAKLVRRRLKEYEHTNKYTMLDLDRAQETLKGLEDSLGADAKEGAHENQLVTVLRMAVGKGADADIPV